MVCISCVRFVVLDVLVLVLIYEFALSTVRLWVLLWFLGWHFAVCGLCCLFLVLVLVVIARIGYLRIVWLMLLLVWIRGLVALLFCGFVLVLRIWCWLGLVFWCTLGLLVLEFGLSTAV